MDKEFWLDIPDLNFYKVSNLGNIKSVDKIECGKRRFCVRKEKTLKLNKDSAGYLTVGLILNSKQKKFLVHRLVAKSFIPNPESKEQVNHINGIKTDNRVENLEWCTRSENAIHSFEIGLQCNKGINHPSHFLTEKQVREIRIKYIPRKYSSYKLAKEYGVSRVTINDIVKRRTWVHI